MTNITVNQKCPICGCTQKSLGRCARCGHRKVVLDRHTHTWSF